MNEPAFPISTEFGEKVYSHGGMTLRDYFAAKALQGMCACSNTYDSTDTKGKPLAEFLAQQAYFVADAMLAERAKHE